MDLSQSTPAIFSNQNGFFGVHPAITEASDTHFLLTTVSGVNSGFSITSFANHFQEFYAKDKARNQEWCEDMVQRVITYTMGENSPPSIPELSGGASQSRFFLPLVVANLRLSFEALGSDPDGNYQFFDVTVCDQNEKPHKEGCLSLVRFAATAYRLNCGFLVFPLICLMELEENIHGRFNKEQRTATIDLTPIARLLGYVSAVYGTVPEMKNPEFTISSSLEQMVAGGYRDGISVKVSNSRAKADLSWMTLSVTFPLSKTDASPPPLSLVGCALTFPCVNPYGNAASVKVTWHANMFYTNHENGGLRQHNMLAAARAFARGLANIRLNAHCVPPMA